MNSLQVEQVLPVSSEQLYSRLATEADTEAVFNLINLAFAKGNPHLVKNRMSLEQVKTHIQKGYFLLATDEGQIAGLIYVEMRGNQRAYLGLLSIHPDQQRNGLGKQLLEASELFCKERGCKVVEGVVMSVRPDLVERYKRLGFVVVGTTSSENYPEFADDLDVPWLAVEIEKQL